VLVPLAVAWGGGGGRGVDSAGEVLT
jgi:Pyruvate/2-oxoacid:ferredoxin oxidoreductase gamma subunit